MNTGPGKTKCDRWSSGNTETDAPVGPYSIFQRFLSSCQPCDIWRQLSSHHGGWVNGNVKPWEKGSSLKSGEGQGGDDSGLNMAADRARTNRHGGLGQWTLNLPTAKKPTGSRPLYLTVSLIYIRTLFPNVQPLDITIPCKPTTVMSHEREGVSNHRQLHCLIYSLFRLTLKKKQRICIIILEPLWRESPGDRWISSQREAFENTSPYFVLIKNVFPWARFQCRHQLSSSVTCHCRPVSGGQPDVPLIYDRSRPGVKSPRTSLFPICQASAFIRPGPFSRQYGRSRGRRRLVCY